MKLKDITRNELQLLIEELDIKGVRHFCIHSFTNILNEFAQEELPEAVLRRVSKLCIRKGATLNNPTNFRNAFDGVDKEGKLATVRFKSHLQTLIPGLNEQELGSLEKAFGSAEGKIDVKTLSEELFAERQRKPVPISKMATIGPEIQKVRKEADSQINKTAITTQALKGKIDELKKENEKLNKRNQDLMKAIEKLEKSKVASMSRPSGIIREQQLKKETIAEKEDFNFLENSQRIAELETKNMELLKKIETEYKPQITKQKSELEKLKGDVKFLKLDNLKLESQIEKMLKKPLDNIEKKNELDYLKEIKIKEQQNKIEEYEQEIQRLNDKFFNLEQSNLVLYLC